MQARDGTIGPGPKIAELIARRIVADISAGDLKPGDALPSEAEMISAYGVGRASVREALRLLEVSGLIKMKPGRNGGPIISAVDARHFGRMATLYFQMTGATLAELLEATILLEPTMVRFIAERQDERQLGELRRVMAEADGLAADDVQRNFSAGSHFHTAIAQMTGNRVLDLLSAAVREIYRDRLDVTAPWAEIRRDHKRIAAAIFAGDAERAEQLMSKHMTKHADVIRRLHPALLAQVIDWT